MNHIDRSGMRTSDSSPSGWDFPALENKNEEKLSVYYLTTIQSLKTSETVSPEELDRKNQDLKIGEEKIEISTLRKWGQWILSLFWSPCAPQSPTEINKGEAATSPLSNIPKLQPAELDRKRLARSLTDLNRDLVHRLKETSEFEEEMRKSGKKNIDKLIFLHLFELGMKQKKAKEESGIDNQEEILKKHHENKKLQQKFFSIWDDIREGAKKSSFLGWINLGSTVGLTGLFAVSFATGGTSSLIMLALPLLSFVQGTTKAGEGLLKYQNDKKSGELTMIKEKTDENSTMINSKMQGLKTNDQEVAQLLRALRHHLENQSKAERIFQASAFTS